MIGDGSSAKTRLICLIKRNIKLSPCEWKHPHLGDVTVVLRDFISSPTRLFVNNLSRLTKIPRLRIECNPPVTGEFLSQGSIDAERVSLQWRHHKGRTKTKTPIVVHYWNQCGSASCPSRQLVAHRQAIVLTNADYHLWDLRQQTSVEWSFESKYGNFIQENKFENVICKIVAIMSRPEYVKTSCGTLPRWYSHSWSICLVYH